MSVFNDIKRIKEQIEDLTKMVEEELVDRELLKKEIEGIKNELSKEFIDRETMIKILDSLIKIIDKSINQRISTLKSNIAFLYILHMLSEHMPSLNYNKLEKELEEVRQYALKRGGISLREAIDEMKSKDLLPSTIKKFLEAKQLIEDLL